MGEKKVGIHCLRKMKQRGEKIVALTAYDYSSARILDEAGVDLLLVGDSAAGVILGYDSTLPVRMDEMLVLSAAVARGTRRALVVADMPFMSFQVSPERAMANAGRFVKEARVGAVKLEGGERSLPSVERIVAAGIPVMGHLGLTPQSVLQMGYRVQGRRDKAAERIKTDALALQEAGVFALVLEGIPWTLGAEISQALRIPTIGIGAGEHCDGQILVLHDMLGLSDTKYTFVKRYEGFADRMAKAVGSYAEEVRAGDFPAAEHRFEAESEAAGKGKGSAP